MNGLITEREWRKQYLKHSKARPCWWGAQYISAPQRRPALRKDRAFLGFLLLLSCTIGLLLPFFCPMKEKESFEEAQTAMTEVAVEPRSVSAVSYAAPSYVEWHSIRFLLSCRRPIPSALRQWGKEWFLSPA